MSYGIEITDSSGVVTFSSDDYTINVIDSFDVAAGASASVTYTDEGLYYLASNGFLTVTAMEIPYGDYPASSATVKKTIGVTVSGGDVVVAVSGGNMNAHILVITK